VEADAAVQEGGRTWSRRSGDTASPRWPAAGCPGVDDEETGRLPAHLPAQHEIDVELEVVALERVAVHVGHPPHLLADHPGRVVERRGLGQPLALVEVALEQVMIDWVHERLPLLSRMKPVARLTKVCILRAMLT